MKQPYTKAEYSKYVNKNPTKVPKPIDKITSNKGILDDKVFNRPTSAIMQEGERINYHKFISSYQNKDCNKALKRIFKRIDMEKINSIIDETPAITEEHKLFLKTVLAARKEKIIDFSYKRLRKLEKQQGR